MGGRGFLGFAGYVVAAPVVRAWCSRRRHEAPLMLNATALCMSRSEDRGGDDGVAEDVAPVGRPRLVVTMVGVSSFVAGVHDVEERAGGVAIMDVQQTDVVDHEDGGCGVDAQLDRPVALDYGSGQGCGPSV